MSSSSCGCGPAMPAVTTLQAKGASTEIAKKELGKIATKLLDIPGDHGDRRNDQKRLLNELKKDIHADTKNFLALTGRREVEHYKFMEKMIPLVPELEFPGRKPHDFSKDELFHFVAATYFDGGIQSAEMKVFVDAELKRHYVMEAHHPEHELYNDVECSAIDIREMAIDRLARNAQFGNGVISLEVLTKFLPKFPKGDNEAKQALFMENAQKYQDLVQRTFFEMFPEAKEWKNM